MKIKSIVPRRLANLDVRQAVEYYLKQDSKNLANDFIAHLENAYEHIKKFPATGSLRFSHQLALPNLRTWTIKKYPFAIFYIEQSDHIEILRVLHTHRNTLNRF